MKGLELSTQGPHLSEGLLLCSLHLLEVLVPERQQVESQAAPSSQQCLGAGAMGLCRQSRLTFVFHQGRQLAAADLRSAVNSRLYGE